jgi:GTPase SAR1 family protein
MYEPEDLCYPVKQSPSQWTCLPKWVTNAKDEDAVILIVGEGPATITRVEEAK